MGEAAEGEGGHARGNQRAEVEPILMTDSRTRGQRRWPSALAAARGSSHLHAPFEARRRRELLHKRVLRARKQ
jgi:hypothetical protein